MMLPSLGLLPCTRAGRLTDISWLVETAVRKVGRCGIVDGYGRHTNVAFNG